MTGIRGEEVDAWVLDLSNHQGAGFDVTRAVAEGYSAVICKATEGLTFADATFGGFTAAARAAGAIPGAYHYLRAGDGAAQARAFHARVVAAGGPAGWLIALDNEADATWDTTVAWVNEWNRLSGNHPFLMYSGAWWWQPRGWPGSQLTPYLWHARYVTGSGAGSQLYTQVLDSWWTPGYGGWGSATLLQFTSTAQVAGQRVDVSAFRGTVGALRALTTTEVDVQLSDAVGGTATGDHPQDRSVAEILGDMWGLLAHGRTVGGDHPGVGAYADSPLAPHPLTISDAQVAQLASALAGRPDNPLGQADLPAIEAGLRAVLRELLGGIGSTP